MEPFYVRRAVEAARSFALEFGFQVDDAIVVYNSDRVAVRLVPCDVLVRVGLQASADGFRFEVEVVRRLAEIDSPVGALAPRVEPRVYTHDNFSLTFWTYYDHTGKAASADYAAALSQLHACLQQIDVAAPHVTARVAAWVEEVNDPDKTPELPAPDRDFLSSTFERVRNAVDRRDTPDQLLHGEPHPGNLLNTPSGPRFIDFHTCQRGPVEYDLAYLPAGAAAYYPEVNQALVHQFRILMRAGFTTMRWRPNDQFPDRDYWRTEGLNQLRAELDRT